MNYSQALGWLYSTQQFGIKPGLDKIRRLLAALGFHGNGQRFLHVAGTNGKGSVCAMLDAACRAEGLRTGLYTSPHLVTFRERIRLGGEMISREATADGLGRIREIVAGWEGCPTFFEITTALALDFFQREHAGVVVLETGLGGRFDATNTVTPAVSVLTPISLDHMAWLGTSLGEIAAEKGGIIKPGAPVVSSPQLPEVVEVLRQLAEENNAPLTFVTESLEKCPVGLAGSHQKWNAALAQAALRASGLAVSEDSLRRGLADVSWPCRFEQIKNQKLEIKNSIILDGAHNAAAAECLARTWRDHFGDAKATVILGVLRDKDADAICRALIPIAASFVVTPVRNPRTSSPEQLRDILLSMAPEAECHVVAGLEEALGLARIRPEKILVTGSLFLAGEALAFFTGEEADPEISAQ